MKSADTCSARVRRCPLPWRLGRWWPPPSTHWMAPVAIHCRYTYAAASASTSGFLSGGSSTSSRFTASIFASQLRTVRRREVAARLTKGNRQSPCFTSTHAAGCRPQHDLRLHLQTEAERTDQSSSVCQIRRDQFLHLLGGLLIRADDLQGSALQAVSIPLALAIPRVGIGLHELDVLALPLVVRQAAVSCWACAVSGLLPLIGIATLLLWLVICGGLSCVLQRYESGVETQVQSWLLQGRPAPSTLQHSEGASSPATPALQVLHHSTAQMTPQDCPTGR